MRERPVRVMLVAAEASGDVLGAALARSLRHRLGDRVQFIGVGGAQMAVEGIRSPFDIAELSILGIVEGLLAYRKVVRLADETAALASRDPPDAAVLIDSWGFTSRVAKRLREVSPDTKLIKYVGPQVWASRPHRARALAQSFDHLLSIHAFEPPYFEREGAAVTFVGNPALSRSFEGADGARLRVRLGIAPHAPVLLVAPGSRPSEIKRVLPPFAEAVGILKRERSRLEVLLPVASTVADMVREQARGWPFEVHMIERESDKADAMLAADIALACSGTVTTELAVAGAPMVVGYRLSPVTYAILKRIVRTPYATLFNIAAGRMVAPEMIQDRCNGPALARELALRLDDPLARERQRREQFEALDLMGRGGPDPSEAAADAVLKVLAERGVSRAAP